MQPAAALRSGVTEENLDKCILDIHDIFWKMMLAGLLGLVFYIIERKWVEFSPGKVTTITQK